MTAELATAESPKSSALRTILRNIASSTVGYAVNMLVALLLSPYLVEKLGDDIYGVWSLIISLTGHYGLLDLGIRSAVGHYLAVYWAKRDMEAVNRTMNTATVLMWFAAAIATALTLVLWWVFPTWKPEAHAATPSARTAILIMGLGFAASFPMAIYSTVLYARQRIDLQNVIGISQRVLTALGIVVFLMQGGGILGVACAVMGCNVLSWTANILVARRLMPELRFRPRLFRRESVRELADYGFFNFIVNAADNILVYTDTVVIGLFIAPLAAITYYGIGANLIPYYMSIVFAVTWAFTPYATSLYAVGDREGLRRLMITGTRGTLALATLIGGGLMLVGHDFLALWMGPRFVAGVHFPSSAVILAILAAATLLRGSQSVGRQILFATQEVRFLGLVALGEAVLNLVLSCLLVRHYGLIGVAIGTLVPILLSQGIVQPIFLMRHLDLSLPRFYRNIARTMLSVLVPMDLAYWGFGRHIEAQSWWSLVWKATAIGVPGLLGALTFGLGAQERKWLRARLPGARSR